MTLYNTTGAHLADPAKEFAALRDRLMNIVDVLKDVEANLDSLGSSLTGIECPHDSKASVAETRTEKIAPCVSTSIIEIELVILRLLEKSDKLTSMM